MRTTLRSVRSIALACVLAMLGEFGCAVQAVNAQGTAEKKDSTAATSPLDVPGFEAELKRLDGICSKLNLGDEQGLMQHWIVSDQGDAHLLFLPVAQDPLLTSTATASANAVGNHAAHANWLRHFSTARTRHAQHWFDAARQQADKGDEWTAYLHLWRAAREDSNQPEVKRVLGPLLAALQVKGKPRSVSTVHPQFGWPAGSYQRMETTNFKITSRVDAAETQKIAQELEAFYALWTQAFYPLWAAPNVTAQRIAGRNTNWQRRQQVDVVLCRDRSDYLKTLGVAEANIGVSVGYYNSEAQLSFFYPDESLPATLHHELTHQLLAEASQLRGTKQPGEKTNFWLVEAVALYMESLVQADHHWRLGGWLSERMQGARYRAVHDGYWISPADLDAIGLSQWKDRDDLSRIYTQAAGMAHFFMDRRLPRAERESMPESSASDAEASAAAAEKRLDAFDADQARAVFFSALIAVYRGDAVPDKLWQLAGHPQQDYLHFLLVRDRHMNALKHSGTSTETIKELVLTRSQLSPESWQSIGDCQQLTWLDVSHSNAKPGDLAWLKRLRKLERLSLEGLSVNAELISELATLPDLKELDLSDCPVDDEQLALLKPCPKLETLWLGGSKITAKSLPLLEQLPRLSFVALEGTQVSSSEAKTLSDKIKRNR